MQPFERFTERAKRALVRAQEEAEAAGTSVGTEHLALALLHVRDGLAAKVLRSLDFDVEALERTLREPASPPAGGRPPAAEGASAPTPEVRRAIEIAFHESRQMGHGFVGTEHLLLGLLAQPDSAGAAALTAIGGVTPGNMRRKILGSRMERSGLAEGRPASLAGPHPTVPRLLTAEPAEPTAAPVEQAPEVVRALGEALRRARREGSAELRLDHLLLAIAADPGGAEMLRALGVDPEGERMAEALRKRPGAGPESRTPDD